MLSLLFFFFCALYQSTHHEFIFQLCARSVSVGSLWANIRLCTGYVLPWWPPSGSLVSFRSHLNRLPSRPAGFSLQHYPSPGCCLCWKPGFLDIISDVFPPLGDYRPPAAFWVGVIGGKFSKTLPISKCSPFTLGWLCQWRENSWLEVILLGCLMSSDLWSRLHLTCFSILGAFRVFSLLT